MVFPWEQQSVSCLMDASIFITAAAWELKLDSRVTDAILLTLVSVPPHCEVWGKAVRDMPLTRCNHHNGSDPYPDVGQLITHY